MLSVDPLKREAYNTLSSFDVKPLFLFNFKSIFEVNHKLKNQTKPPYITLIKGFKKVLNHLVKTSVSAAVLAAVPKREAHYRDPFFDRKCLFQKNVQLLNL
jgi:hypothetical protein